MTQIFQISDGTTTIDLLSPTGNYHLAKWESGISQWKDGGIFSENPLVDGRVPIDRAFDSVQEKITIHITGSSQDNVISSLRSLLTLLDTSYTYFAESTAVPAYLIVKSDTETNTRYAVIVSYKIDNLPGQFDGPFLAGGKQFSGNLSYPAIYVELELVIERDHWLNAAPGSSVNISIQNQYSYNSTTYGQAATSSSPVYISAIRADSNITHIYRFDTSASTWSSNLVGTAPPFNILPTSTTAGDIVYFGVNSSLPNSGIPHNLVFNISTPASGITGTWEASVSPSSWNILSGSDYTQNPPYNSGTLSTINSFTKSGLGEVVVTQLNNLAATPINLLTVFGGSAPNVTGFWIRFRVTSVSSPTVPQQGTGLIFSSNKPFVEINSASIGGDIPALSKVTIRGRANTKIAGPSGYVTAGSLFLGIRKYSRGSLFTGYLNASDEQNPTGITVTTSATAGFVDKYNSSTGRAVRATAGSLAGGDEMSVTWTFASSISKHFIGNFRTFVRFLWLNTTSQSKIILRAGEMDLYESEWITNLPVPISADVSFGVTDMGILNIPYSGLISRSLTTDILESVSIILKIKNTGSFAVDAYVNDLILIPADESIVEVREVLNSNTATNGIYYNRNLEIDNITLPGIGGRAFLKDTTSGNIVNVYRLINTKGLEIPTQRSLLWFLYYDKYVPTSTADPPFNLSSLENTTFGISIATGNRYILPRGAI